MTDSDDDQIILTPEEAEALFPDGDTVHNFVGGGMMLIGCDFDRADAIAHLRAAQRIEIGGPGCKAMRHPIAVTEKNGRVTFFEADMAKVEAFEAGHAAKRAA